MGREEMFAVVEKHIRTIVEGAREKEILEANSMRDFGADSLETVEVVSRSMKDLRIKVPRIKLMEARSLKDLLDLFEQAEVKAPIA